MKCTVTKTVRCVLEDGRVYERNYTPSKMDVGELWIIGDPMMREITKEILEDLRAKEPTNAPASTYIPTRLTGSRRL